MTETFISKAAEVQDFSPPRPGYIFDYISGEAVKATPEETQAVQVFQKRLVEDYGYPKSQIRTRPQFRVRKRPSDESKSYPIDIAVFKTNEIIEDNLYIIVECKRKIKKDGVSQLKLYMDMSPAEVGVWFNGDEHVYLRKVHHKDGSREYHELPNIPRFGQRIEDIGLFKRKDLTRPSNLKAVFHDLRNHLAGMTTGITRDEALAQEIINILFCKILDEQETLPDDTVTFHAGVGEASDAIKHRILGIFERVKTIAYDDVFSEHDTIHLDADSVRYVVGELQIYCITQADRDAIGDAFEVFIGPALRGAEGQFFTPRNVVKMMVEILDPKPGEKVIDPASGSGGFLITALEHVWRHLKSDATERNWTERTLVRKEVEIATDCFRGLDKDAFLAKVCKAYMALIGDGRGGVFCENALLNPKEWHAVTQSKIRLESFDVLLTNPPFGTKIPIKGSQILSQYELGYRWTKDKHTGALARSDKLEDKRPPQILFLERCLQFLRPGGRMGIVLPESMLGNPSYEYIINFIQSNATIIAIVTLPEPLFKTSGKGGTHTKVCALFLRKGIETDSSPIFMADAKWCGHDSRGNPTIRKNQKGEYVLLDDVPKIVDRFRAFTANPGEVADHLGFPLNPGDVRNRILVPKYYDPEIEADLRKLANTHHLRLFEDLRKEKIISVDTGIEIGKMAYGTGTIPFIRTSDLSNWEIKADFKHGISEDIYNELKHKVDVKAGDILLVRDGTYLIGTSAIVTESDIPMLFQSHIYRIRVLQPEALNPWLLFACLNAPIVKRQIRAKQFTQDIIDTLGKRLFELIVPILRDEVNCARLAREVQEIIETRNKLRNRATAIALELEGISEPRKEDLDAISEL